MTVTKYVSGVLEDFPLENIVTFLEKSLFFVNLWEIRSFIFFKIRKTTSYDEIISMTYKDEAIMFVKIVNQYVVFTSLRSCRSSIFTFQKCTNYRQPQSNGRSMLLPFSQKMKILCDFTVIFRLNLFRKQNTPWYTRFAYGGRLRSRYHNVLYGTLITNLVNACSLLVMSIWLFSLYFSSWFQLTAETL